jgi:hypothetical protein
LALDRSLGVVVMLTGKTQNVVGGFAGWMLQQSEIVLAIPHALFDDDYVSCRTVLVQVSSQTSQIPR